MQEIPVNEIKFRILINMYIYIFFNTFHVLILVFFSQHVDSIERLLKQNVGTLDDRNMLFLIIITLPVQSLPSLICSFCEQETGINPLVHLGCVPLILKYQTKLL